MCAQSCPVLCNLMDCSSVHGFFQGKNTRMTCHFLLWKIFPIPGIKPTSPASPALTGRFFTTEPPGKLSEKKIISVKSIFHIIYVADFVFLSDHNNISPIPFGFFQNDIINPPPRAVIHVLYRVESRQGLCLL